MNEDEQKNRLAFVENSKALTNMFTEFAHANGFDQVDKLSRLLHINAIIHGWHDDYNELADALGPQKAQEITLVNRLFLIISEVSELAEELRAPNINWRHANIEMADIIIRAFDTFATLLDFSQANDPSLVATTPGGFIAQKAKQNLLRSYRHGEKRF